MSLMMALRVPKIKAKLYGAAELGVWPQTVLATTPSNLDLILATHFYATTTAVVRDQLFCIYKTVGNLL